MTESTVVVLTSDHGDMLGEKGLWYKMSPYERSSRVPLILRGPRELVPAGRFANPVSLLDLLPTLVELAGAEPPSTDGAGVSLLESARREVSGVSPQERDVVVEYLAEGTHHPQVTLVRGPLKLVRCPGDPDQLFDLGADPDELRNVAQEPRYADVVAAMRAEIEARYDLEALEVEVLASQRRRSVVAHALLQGRTRPWDLTVQEQERYVRGDFWAAFRYAKLADGQG